MNQIELFKIQTYCPKDAADKVRMAIGDGGGGKLGNYSHCVFMSTGHSYFLPLEGADPAIGEVGKMERVEEVKIEFICEKDKLKQVVEAIKKAHPYEEVAIDVIQLIDFES